MDGRDVLIGLASRRTATTNRWAVLPNGNGTQTGQRAPQSTAPCHSPKHRRKRARLGSNPVMSGRSGGRRTSTAPKAFLLSRKFITSVLNEGNGRDVHIGLAVIMSTPTPATSATTRPPEALLLLPAALRLQLTSPSRSMLAPASKRRVGRQQAARQRPGPAPPGASREHRLQLSSRHRRDRRVLTLRPWAG